MLRSALLALLAVGVAIGGGAGSVWLAIGAGGTIGAIELGGWTSLPDRGTPTSDPYARAQLARDGMLALGHAEGLAFTAERDSQGRPLVRECRYTLSGTLPAARLWTLHAATPDLEPVAGPTGRPATLNSYGALYGRDGAVDVAIGAPAAPGNWLPVTGAGSMVLILMLYDTPLAGDADLADTALPRITLEGCDG